jgi:DNA-binding MarR family transcriptional regulator
MGSVPSTKPADAQRRKRRLTNEIKESLRELRIQLVLLNQRVGGRLDLRNVDLDCLDLVSRYGPISPGALARSAGLHPATMTGILDRLERNGWIARERDPGDRRAVVVRALPDRGGEAFRLYAGMRAAMDDICADYDVEQLQLIAGFLARVSVAGERSAEELAEPDQP